MQMIMVANTWIIFFFGLFIMLLVSLLAPSFFPFLLLCLVVVSGSFIFYARFLVPILIVLTKTCLGTTTSFLLAVLFEKSSHALELLSDESVESIISLFSLSASLDYRSKQTENMTKVLAIVLKKNVLCPFRIIYNGGEKVLLDVFSTTSVTEFNQEKLVTSEYVACCILELMKNNHINVCDLRSYVERNSVSAEEGPNYDIKDFIRNLVFLIRFGSERGVEIAIQLMTILLYDSHFREIILTFDVYSVLISALCDTSKDSNRSNAILAISVLICDDESIRLHLIEKGLLSVLMYSLSASDAKIKRHAALCIQILASQMSLVPELVRCGTVSRLIEQLNFSMNLSRTSYPRITGINDDEKIIEYSLLSLFYLFSVSESAKIEGLSLDVGNCLINLIRNMHDINVRISENAVRALGSLAIKSKLCDYSEELIVGGAIHVLCRSLASKVCTLRLHSLLALEILMRNKRDVTHKMDMFLYVGEKYISLVEFINRILTDSQFVVEKEAAISLLRMIQQ